MHTSPRHQKQKLLQTRAHLLARFGSRVRDLFAPTQRGRKRLIGLSILTGLGVSTGVAAVAHDAEQASPSLDSSSVTTSQKEDTPPSPNEGGVSVGSENSSSVTEVKTDIVSSDGDATVESTITVDGQPVLTSNSSHQNIVVEGSNSDVSVNVSVDGSSSSNSSSSSSTDISVSSTNSQGNQTIRGSPRR